MNKPKKHLKQGVGKQIKFKKMKKSLLVLIAIVFATGLSSFGQTKTRYNYVYSVNSAKATVYIAALLSCEFEVNDRSYKNTSKVIEQFQSYTSAGKGYNTFTNSDWTTKERAEEKLKKAIKFYKFSNYKIIYKDYFTYNNR